MDKDIQKGRMKKCFIDAAKEILISEGVSNVSVRKVGEATGYSYATIYNYFNNLNHLLWYVGLEFILDLFKIYEEDFKKDKYTFDDIEKILKNYVEYYLRNPNVFKFFFFHQVEEPEEVVKGEVVRPSFEKVQINILENLAHQNVIRHEEVKMISSIIMNSVHGILLMYFSRKRKLTEQDVYIQIEEMTRILLRR